MWHNIMVISTQKIESNVLSLYSHTIFPSSVIENFMSETLLPFSPMLVSFHSTWPFENVCVCVSRVSKWKNCIFHTYSLRYVHFILILFSIFHTIIIIKWRTAKWTEAVNILEPLFNDSTIVNGNKTALLLKDIVTLHEHTFSHPPSLCHGY